MTRAQVEVAVWGALFGAALAALLTAAFLLGLPDDPVAPLDPTPTSTPEVSP